MYLWHSFRNIQEDKRLAINLPAFSEHIIHASWMNTYDWIVNGKTQNSSNVSRFSLDSMKYCSVVVVFNSDSDRQDQQRNNGKLRQISVKYFSIP